MIPTQACGLVAAALAGIIAWHAAPLDGGLWLALAVNCIERKPSVWLYAYGAAIAASDPNFIMVKAVAVSTLGGVLTYSLNMVEPTASKPELFKL
jgi:hypothetical protein